MVGFKVYIINPYCLSGVAAAYFDGGSRLIRADDAIVEFGFE